MLLKEKKRAKENDNWNFWIWLFLPKNGRFVKRNSFSKNALLKPLFFIVFFGCALSGPSCQKREFLDTPQKMKVCLITESFFLVLFVFLHFLSLFFFFVFLLYFCFFCFCCFLGFVFFVLFFGGFKGQVRWPEGPPHLALNPSCLFFFLFRFCVFLSFLSLLLKDKKKPVSP